MLDWKYEWRREAQKVLPFMYLGPVSAARDRDFLKREGVTMLLAVRDTKSAHARLLNSSNVADEIGIEFEAVDVAGNQELIAAFPYAIQLVNKHLTEVYNRSLPSPSRGTNGELRAAKTKPSTGKVLVYCESGNERSAGVVAAYIMAMYDVDIIKALQVVQAQRFCVCFDDPMKNLLDSYAAILQAKRDVARAKALSKDKNTAPGQIRSATKSTGGKSPNKRGKRSLDEAYETDLEMGDAYGQIDEDRFGQRAGFAPFEDW
ncbi:MAG: hypothetical protein M1827_005201 [Pycnora praestabilis]|nr:MAG: hypothetical protein M1827_005201 [Pycnora praestabilis]